MHVNFAARAGISMVEVIVALVMASVLGATATSAFVTQSRFYSSQEETDFARGVGRRAMTIMVSELRMLEQEGGIAAATSKSITVRAPYAMGVVCGNVTVLTISRMPVDAEVLSSAGYSGYAYRDRATGRYTYVEGAATAPAVAGAPICTAAGMSVYSGGGGNLDGQAMQFTSVPTPAPAIGTTVFLYQRITYEFANSVSVPGRVALWRRIEETGVNEEIVAPFDTTAGFRFYVNDAAVPQADVPAALSSITGIELRLDAFGERAGLQRTGQLVPLTTSVFFKNRSTS
jgi:hypothetical protein